MKTPHDSQALRSYLDQLPLGDQARAQLFDMIWSDRDVLSGKTARQRLGILEHLSYRDFLKQYWQADEEVLKYLQTRTHDLWAVGIDAVPASETLGMPGLKAQRAALSSEHEEPYIYHFPDGNASIARLLVRRLIPGIAPGSTMEDIVLARFDYATNRSSRASGANSPQFDRGRCAQCRSGRGNRLCERRQGCARRGRRLRARLLSRHDSLHRLRDGRRAARSAARQCAGAAGLRERGGAQLATLAQARRGVPSTIPAAPMPPRWIFRSASTATNSPPIRPSRRACT